LFEIAQGRTRTLQAHDAILQSPAHDASPARDTADRRPQLRAALGILSGVRRWSPRPTALLLAALAIGLGLGAAEEAARLTGSGPKLERAARFMGFGVDQVTLSGHHFSFDRDVFDALDLANVRTFSALDTASVKSRIERLPWIDTAEITRVYPGRLDIRVTERKPYALWLRADRNYLIDRTGRVLAAVGGESLPDLPRFSGEGAADGASALLEQLARYPEVKTRFREAERVSERRWRLKLANASVIELPADGEIGALEALARDPALARLVTDGAVTLDFRGPGRAAVRPAEQQHTSEAVSGPGS